MMAFRKQKGQRDAALIIIPQDIDFVGNGMVICDMICENLRAVHSERGPLRPKSIEQVDIGKIRVGTDKRPAVFCSRTEPGPVIEYFELAMDGLFEFGSQGIAT